MFTNYYVFTWGERVGLICDIVEEAIAVFGSLELIGCDANSCRSH